MAVLLCLLAVPLAWREEHAESINPYKDSIGIVLAGQVVERSWSFENRTSEVLVFDEIIPSCGCVKVLGFSRSVEPGELMTVNYKLDLAGARPGPFEQTLFLSERSGRSQFVRLEASVLPAVELQSPVIYLTVDPVTGRCLGKAVLFIPHELGEVEISVDNLPLSLAVAVSKSANGDKDECSLSFESTASYSDFGDLRWSLCLHATSKAMTTHIPLTAVQPNLARIACSPRVIHVLRAAKPTTVRVYLRHNEASPGLQAKLTPEGSGAIRRTSSGFEVELEVDAPNVMSIVLSSGGDSCVIPVAFLDADSEAVVQAK